MAPQNEQQPATSQAFPWPKVLPSLTVFAATFLLLGMLWPAMSTGTRASVSIDFSLPPNTSTLTQEETNDLESLLATQLSTLLSGPKFESLIWQTKRTGAVYSNAIEYFDHETIHQNIGLGVTPYYDGGQVKIEYICQGKPDQLRFLQLVGQQVATSIEGFYVNKNNQIVAGNQLSVEELDRAIWLANQIQGDLSQIQNTRSASHNQATDNRRNPYSFASAKKISVGQMQTRRSTMPKTDLNSIDANSLVTLLNQIKTQTAPSNANDATFSVLPVSPAKTRAINATPNRTAMLGLIVMSCVVTGLVAVFQFAPVKQPTNIDKLSESLGIPVIAVLPTDSPTKSPFINDQLLSTVSQTLIVASKYFLIATAIVIVGFSILDKSIGESFFQNPFDGLARIFHVFIGHA